MIEILHQSLFVTRRRHSLGRLMGRGDEKAADQVAVDAMRAILDSIEFSGTVVIGEGAG